MPNKGKEIILIPRPTKLYSYYKVLKNIRRSQNDIIHFNLSYANFIPVVLARLAGYKNIIIHSHSTEIDDGNTIKRAIKKVIHNIGKTIAFPYIAKDFWSCSNLAATWMYPSSVYMSKGYLAHNAINLSKYQFDSNKRDTKRKELNLSDDTICLGHVGRFSYQKNHVFLVEVVNVLIKRGLNVKLLLIGGMQGGVEYFNAVKSKIKEYNITDHVIFLGTRDDVPDLFQAMDWFLLPSRFEGLGIVGVEAQANGLPCIFSDTTPKEIQAHDNIKFLSINNAKPWAEYIFSNIDSGRILEQDKLVKAGYSDKIEILNVENRYELMLKNQLNK